MSSSEEWETLCEKSRELRRYADLEGSEIGEMCTFLVALAQYPDYMSNDFKAALIKEIDENLINFSQNATIVRKKETITRTVEKFEWVD